MATKHSILFYGAEIWADSLKSKKYRHAMTTAQNQGALRIACSYRTVSAQAVLMIAGVIPIGLLASERKSIYGRSADMSRQDAVAIERDRTIQKWQQRWTEETKDNWTRRLIRNLKPWITREIGDDYRDHLTRQYRRGNAPRESRVAISHHV